MVGVHQNTAWFMYVVVVGLVSASVPGQVTFVHLGDEVWVQAFWKHMIIEH